MRLKHLRSAIAATVLTSALAALPVALTAGPASAAPAATVAPAVSHITPQDTPWG